MKILGLSTNKKHADLQLLLSVETGFHLMTHWPTDSKRLWSINEIPFSFLTFRLRQRPRIAPELEGPVSPSGEHVPCVRAPAEPRAGGLASVLLARRAQGPFPATPRRAAWFRFSFGLCRSHLPFVSQTNLAAASYIHCPVDKARIKKALRGT